MYTACFKSIFNRKYVGDSLHVLRYKGVFLQFIPLQGGS